MFESKRFDCIHVVRLYIRNIGGEQHYLKFTYNSAYTPKLVVLIGATNNKLDIALNHDMLNGIDPVSILR